MTYDVARVRGLYTSLGDGWTYLNAHQFPQVPEKVSSGVATAFRTHAQFPFDQTRGQDELAPMGLRHVELAREAVADLAGVSADQIVLGPSRDSLIQVLANSLASFVRPGSGVVLPRHVDPALTRPFTWMGASVSWAEPDLATGYLPDWQYRDLVNGSTRLVVLPAAHSLVGPVVPVGEIVDTVRQRSRAWVLVDASSYAAYRPLELDAWQADILLIDVAELGGPQVCALVFRDTSMFPRMNALVPGVERGSARKLEIGSLPNGLIGGVRQTIDHLASLDEDATGTRAERIQTSMSGLAGHVTTLNAQLIESLRGLPAVHIVGISGDAPGEGAAELDRLPRLSFMVNGVPPQTVQRRLLDNGLVTTVTPADPLLDAMGFTEVGGSVTVGLGPFSASYEVDQLTRVLASLA